MKSINYRRPKLNFLSYNNFTYNNKILKLNQMKHKEINELEDKNLKKIMRLIKKLETSQNKLRKIINKNKNGNERTTLPTSNT